MHYFAVNFTAKINGLKTEAGTAGVESRLNDYLPVKVKEKIRAYYKQLDDSIRTVGVILTGHEILDQDEYKNGKADFKLIVI